MLCFAVLCFAVLCPQGPVPEGLGELGLRVALSVGELDKEAYQALYDAGEGGGGRCRQQQQGFRA